MVILKVLKCQWSNCNEIASVALFEVVTSNRSSTAQGCKTVILDQPSTYSSRHCRAYFHAFVEQLILKQLCTAVSDQEQKHAIDWTQGVHKTTVSFQVSKF